MENPEFFAVEQQAIQQNAIEDARNIAQHLSREANENLCTWLSHEVANSSPEQRAKARYELSDKRASQALNVYKFLTRAVYS
jgi:replicative DNA helicase